MMANRITTDGLTSWGRVVAVTAAAGLAMAGTAAVTTATAEDAATQFSGCLTTAGELTRVKFGTEPLRACRAKDTPVTWNARGPQGPPGQPGVDGQDGTDGDPGADGASAYDLAVGEGFQGTLQEWLDSLSGEDGQDGQSCTVAEAPSGTFTMTCPDGTSAVWTGEPADTTDPASDVTFLADVEAEIIAAVNEARTNGVECPTDEIWTQGTFSAGLPLQDDSELSSAARAHVEDMIVNSFLGYESSDGEQSWTRTANDGYTGTFLGESILASVAATTGSEAVDRWLGSAGQCQIIMLTDATEIGVAAGEWTGPSGESPDYPFKYMMIVGR